MSQIDSTNDLPTKPILDNVKQYIDKQGWQSELIDYSDVRKGYQLSFKMENGCYKTFFDVNPAKHLFSVFSYCPIDIPEKNRMQVAELLTRINFTLLLGCFEMDMEDGQIRYRNTVCVEGSHLSMEMISIMENTALSVMDDFFPVMMSVAHGGRTPQQALEMLNDTPEDTLSDGYQEELSNDYSLH